MVLHIDFEAVPVHDRGGERPQDVELLGCGDSGMAEDVRERGAEDLVDADAEVRGRTWARAPDESKVGWLGQEQETRTRQREG